METVIGAIIAFIGCWLTYNIVTKKKKDKIGLILGLGMIITGGYLVHEEYERQERIKKWEEEKAARKLCPSCFGDGCPRCRYTGYINTASTIHFKGSLGCMKCSCSGWAGSLSKGGICGRKIGTGKICTHTYVEHRRASD